MSGHPFHRDPGWIIDPPVGNRDPSRVMVLTVALDNPPGKTNVQPERLCWYAMLDLLDYIRSAVGAVLSRTVFGQ